MVMGPQAREYLQGQVTADLERLRRQASVGSAIARTRAGALSGAVIAEVVGEGAADAEPGAESLGFALAAGAGQGGGDAGAARGSRWSASGGRTWSIRS